jgi:tripartite-type tricarboxylate transporter receptor subunit TctC
MGGQIHTVFGNLPEIWSHVKSGKVRGIAVTGPKRSPGFPELPTVGESGVPGYSAVSWGGVIAPAGVSKPIVDRLNAEVNRAVADPGFRRRYADIGNEPLTGTPEQFAKFIREERAKWAKVVKEAGIKAD